MGQKNLAAKPPHTGGEKTLYYTYVEITPVVRIPGFWPKNSGFSKVIFFRRCLQKQIEMVQLYLLMVIIGLEHS